MKILFQHCGLWLLCIISTSSPAFAEEFTQNFRGRGYDSKAFRPTGSNPMRVIRADAQGLRITLPADHNSKLPVGLVSRFAVRGDFEITMVYEILRVDKPTSGYGAGVSVYITMVSPTAEAATIGRLVRGKGEQVHFSHRASTPVGKGREHHGSDVASENRAGKVRLVRSGSTLSYQVADGDSNAFREIDERELGTHDLNMIRVAADNGGSPTLVDVRIKSLTIRADSLPSQAAELKARSTIRWPVWLAGGLMVILLAAGGFWLWSRRVLISAEAGTQ